MLRSIVFSPCAFTPVVSAPLFARYLRPFWRPTEKNISRLYLSLYEVGTKPTVAINRSPCSVSSRKKGEVSFGARRPSIALVVSVKTVIV